MKKNIIIIVAICLSFSALGQKATPLKKVMSISAPASLTQITKAEYLEILKNNFQIGRIAESENDVFYKRGTVNVAIKDYRVSDNEKKTLESERRLLTNALKNSVLESKIITVNNQRFAVVTSQSLTGRAIVFISDYDKNNGRIHGLIRYKNEDEAKAREVLQSLLENMKFNEPIN